nr:putative reverse transcriptase, RNA-dependent DNA polymerase [Tanacetum cinerariifolium]
MESQLETTQTVYALKLLVLKTREYELWSMRIEQYITFTDHALWEVIVNDYLVSSVASASTKGPIPPKTAEQKLAKNKLKRKSTLMLAILDEHLLKFHACKDAKSLWEAIKNRFGGNKESKKMQKTILKQNYEYFDASSQVGLDKTYDRFQKLISQLKIYGEVISQEDANLNSSSNSQNVAIVFLDNTSSTNETVNTAHSVSAASSKDQASNASYVDDVIYLKGQPKLGLWYPRDSPFDLDAFSDSDYAGASLDKKSTIGGCQFLEKRLILWQCKKEIVVSNSTTEAEYVVAANCHGHVLWIQNQMLDYGFNFMNTKIYIDNKSTICIVKNLGEGSTVTVESHYTPTGAPSTSPPHISSPPRSSIRQETELPQPSSPTHTHVADEATSTGVDVRHGGAATTVTSLDARQGSGNIDKTSSIPYDLPLPRLNTLGSDEGSMTLQELTVLCTTLSQKVESLKADLKQIKKVNEAAYTKLIIKVKKLKKTVKTSKARRKAKIVVSDEEVDLADPSKQGRKIEEIDQDPSISLIQPVTTASVDISPASPTRRVSTADDITMAETLVYIKRSAAKRKDKAMRLQEQFDEEERQRIARVHEAAQTFTKEEWEKIRERVEADEELTQRLQAEERDKSKKKKIGESSEPRNKDVDELSQEELQQLMIIVPEQGMNVEALQTKYPIIDWEIYNEDTRKYWKIIRVENHTE